MDDSGQASRPSGGSAEKEKMRNEFVSELVKNERRLYAFILSIVPNWNDADEIYQETILRLWEGFDRFEPESSFAAWAIRTAHFQILTWRKKVSRNKLVFGRQVVDMIVDAHAQTQRDTDDLRHTALNICIQKLSDGNRELLRQCYAEDAKIRTVAERLNRSLESVYKALQRIRLSLHKCINEQVAAEGVE